MSYPSIPLAGRITALADVFDALTTRRPYKRALSNDLALSIVQMERGGHFDPEVVDSFFDVLPEILTIQHAHRDTETNMLFRYEGVACETN